VTTDGTFLYFVDSEGSAVRSASIPGRGEVKTLVGPRNFPRGRSLFEFGDIDGVGAEARLQHPLGLQFVDGGLYVADTYNHKIRYVDLATQQCSTWLGTGRRGAGLDPVELSEPSDVAVFDGRMYIADANNHRILVVDMASRAASEFVVEGLTPPAPPTSQSVDVDAPAAQPLPDRTLHVADAVVIELQPQLPEGFKLNVAAPQWLRISAPGEQSLLPPDQLNQRLEGQVTDGRVRWELPTLAQQGAGTFELQVGYAYCRDGVGGVCRFGRAHWRVSIRLASDGVEDVLRLSIAPDGPEHSP
jgi:hypothetical protein